MLTANPNPDIPDGNESKFKKADLNYGYEINRSKTAPQQKFVRNSDFYSYAGNRSDPSSVTILCGGYLMCEAALSKAACVDGEYDFRACFRPLKPLFEDCDCAIASLGTLVSDRIPYSSEIYKVQHHTGTRYHCNAPAAYLDGLKYAGLDALVLANNHNGDGGYAGIVGTLDNIDDRGFMRTGMFHNEGEQRFILMDIRGIKIAVLSYTEYISKNLDSETLTPEGCAVMVNRFSEAALKTDIEDARRKGAEFIIVYEHFLGDDYSSTVRPSQQARAQLIADSGADCILGTHAHAIQKYDVLTSCDGKQVPVVYSLGNLISSDGAGSITRRSVVYKLILRRAPNDNLVEIAQESIVPLRTVESIGQQSFAVYPLLKKYLQGVKSQLLDETLVIVKKEIGGLISLDEFMENEDGIFTKDSLFSGYTTEHLNSMFLSTEERARELKKIFYQQCGYYLDLDNPKTLNQKIQWLKLYYKNPVMSRCVDKAEFKKYISEKVGSEYVVPLYGVWDNENDIDFDSLPNSFVLKSNVQSNGRHIIVVKDKKSLDLDHLKTVLSQWLIKRNTLCCSYCWAYHDVEPKILAEEYVSEMGEDLLEYKFWCFNGKAELLYVTAERNNQVGVNFYDLDWNLLPFTWCYPNNKTPFKKPRNFQRMIELANQLAKPFPFVRVDFYESADKTKVYIGELTFYSGGGYENFKPIDWDYKLGEMLKLPAPSKKVPKKRTWF